MSTAGRVDAQEVQDANLCLCPSYCEATVPMHMADLYCARQDLRKVKDDKVGCIKQGFVSAEVTDVFTP